MSASEAAAPGADSLPDKWRIPFELGWSVIPIKAGTKLPAIARWKKYQTQRATLEEVQAWCNAGHDVAIVTGSISGIVVLDLDSEEAIAEAKRRGLPDTPMVKTGKGMHVYFRHPGSDFPNKAAFLAGMDIRGDGGYVIAPGSTHENGHVYEWV